MDRARKLPIVFQRIFFGSDYARYERLRRAGRIQVGRGTYGAPCVETYAHDNTRLVVGRYTSIAKSATFILGGNHPMDRVTTYPLRIRRRLRAAGTDGYPSSKGDIIVGSDVWLCYGCLVLSGVAIGNGAVVTAGSVVTGNVPSFAVVGGNPARLLRYRFGPEIRNSLNEIAWWNWSATEVDDAVTRLAGT